MSVLHINMAVSELPVRFSYKYIFSELRIHFSVKNYLALSFASAFL